MTEKNFLSDKETQTVAKDTGKRIDLGDFKLKTTTLRKKPNQRHEPRPLKEAAKAPRAATATFHEERPKIAPKPQMTPETISRITTPVETVEFDDSGDFAALLEESGFIKKQDEKINLNMGDKVFGKVVYIGDDYVFLSLGSKLEAVIPSIELTEKNLKIGDEISAYVTSLSEGVMLSTKLSANAASEDMLHQALSNKIPVEGKVISVNKGGYEILISSKKAFCPLGQIDDKYVTDPNTFIGLTAHFLIEKIEESGRNIVVSRRKLLETQNEVKALETLESIEPGKVIQGSVSRICDFGAFVDIGGIEGLIPRSEISHGRIDKVSDVLSSGDNVTVCVLSVEKNQEHPRNSKVGLSLKKTKEDPYMLHWDKIKPGTIMQGKVVRLENFGVFVELFEGIDGLIHISELSEQRIMHPSEVLSINDLVNVNVLEVNNEQKRISLSIRDPLARKTKVQQEKQKLNIQKDQKVNGNVCRIERYGVFLELENGGTALLPRSEVDLPKHSDLNKAFKLGERLEVLVIDVDKDGRIKVSLNGRKQMEENDSYLNFHHEQEKKTPAFGTLFDLLNKKKQK